jgi:hypothetical protein
MYTDDPQCGAIGVVATCDLLLSLCDVIGPDGADFTLARDEKWQACGANKWLGANTAAALGMLWLPRDKQLRAMAAVDDVCAGRVHKGEYLRIHGFLEHLAFATSRPRNMMYGLDSPLYDDSIGVADLVIPTVGMRRKLREWRAFIANFSGVSIMQALNADVAARGQALTATSAWVRGRGVPTWHLRSDAAINQREPDTDEDGGADGLGGCLHAEWWRLPLDEGMRRLPIAVLEFVAAGANAVHFEPRLRGALAVRLEVDAIATPYALRSGAHSHAMRAVHDVLVGSSQWKRLTAPGKSLQVAHTYGESNVVSDAASRNYREVLARVFEQLGVRGRQVELTKAARAFVHAAVQAALQAAEAQAAARERPLTPAETARGKQRRDRSDGDGPPEPSPTSAVAATRSTATAAWFAGAACSRGGVRRLLAIIAVAVSAPWADAVPIYGHVHGTGPVYLLDDSGGRVYHERPSWDGGHHGTPGALARAFAADVRVGRTFAVGVREAHDDGTLGAPTVVHIAEQPLHDLVRTGMTANWYASGDASDRNGAVGPQDQPSERDDADEDSVPEPPYGTECDWCSAVGPVECFAGVFEVCSTCREAHSPGGDGALRVVIIVIRRKLAPPRFLYGVEAIRFMRQSESFGGALPVHVAYSITACSFEDHPPDEEEGERGPPHVVAAPPAMAITTAHDDTCGYEGEDAPWRHTFETAPIGIALSDVISSSSLYEHDSAPAHTWSIGLTATEGASRVPEPPRVGWTPGPTVLPANWLPPEEGGLSRWARVRAEQMMHGIMNDSSPYALRPSDLDSLRASVETMLADLEASAPDSVKGQEASNWKWWEQYTAHMGTTPLRTDAAANAGFDVEGHAREVFLFASMVPWLFERMKGRRRNDKGVLLPPLPSSVLAVLRGVRRAHKRLGVITAPLTMAIQACERLIQRYRDWHGPEALQPRRKEPFTNDVVRKLCNMPAGAVIGGKTVDYGELEWVSLRAQYSTHAQSGLRKSETCVPNGTQFGRKHLSRANLAWKIGGVFVRTPTRAQLASLAEGDYAILVVAPSKADQHGLVWGQAPIYLPWHAGAPICAARALAALELAWELQGEARRAAPLFVSGDAKRAVTHSQADATLERMLRAIGVQDAERATYSMHSWRIYLACALLAKGASHDTIMSMLRWRTDEALRIYARLNDFEYGTWLDVAASASISSVRSANLPPVTGSAAELAAREQAAWLAEAAGADTRGVAPGDRPIVDCDDVIGAMADGVRMLERLAINADSEE